MRVAFVHHHFRPGGVTRVISEQAAALKGFADTILLTGEPPIEPVFIPHVVVPSLAYDRDRHDRKRASEIADEILKFVWSVWKGGADLFHFHNPTLGKNADLLSVMKVLNDRKQNLLLQIHDFAEDGRPWGYSPEEYPSDCHYAVINRRDYRLLIEAGLTEQGLHYLPDAVRPLKGAEGAREEQDLILYPVRAIRRKNIGEAVLLSLFIEKGKKIGITLEPTGPIDVKSYRGWMTFVQERHLPVLFGLGIDRDFVSLLAKTKCMITTSIKEGFGLAFLEPWTGGKMLHGRLLGDICGDFIESGVGLGHLYDKIQIPLSYLDERILHRKWVGCYLERLRQYGLAEKPERIEEHCQGLLKGGFVDFGVLSEDLQMQALVGIVDDDSHRKKVLDVNPLLSDTNLFKESPGLISRNRSIVETEFSGERIRSLLLKAYEGVLGRTVFQSVNKAVLLCTFNRPEKNCLLLCESAFQSGLSVSS